MLGSADTAHSTTQNKYIVKANPRARVEVVMLLCACACAYAEHLADGSVWFLARMSAAWSPRQLKRLVAMATARARRSVMSWGTIVLHLLYICSHMRYCVMDSFVDAHSTYPSLLRMRIEREQHIERTG